MTLPQRIAGEIHDGTASSSHVPPAAGAATEDRPAPSPPPPAVPEIIMVPLPDGSPASHAAGATSAASGGDQGQPPNGDDGNDGNDGNDGVRGPAPESPAGVKTARQAILCEVCGKVVPSTCCGDDRTVDYCQCPRCPICWDGIKKDEDDTQVLDCCHVSWLGRSLLPV